jgi:ATP-dependent DNA helicase RecQ
MLTRDDEKLAAARPQPGLYPPLEVESLQRRAESERSKLRTMVDYAYYPRCRRQYVLEYFGDVDWTARDKRCGACDNCEAVALGKTTGLSETEVNAIRGLLMLVGSLHGRFGRTRIAAIANGTDDDARFDEMPERGCLRGWTSQHILDLLRSLEGAGLIEASRGEYPTISTTRKGDQVGIGKLDPNDIGLQMPTVTKRSRVRKRKR